VVGHGQYQSAARGAERRKSTALYSQTLGLELLPQNVDVLMGQNMDALDLDVML
jgi:hypothetical protein